jgi:hypothetical protein
MVVTGEFADLFIIMRGISMHVVRSLGARIWGEIRCRSVFGDSFSEWQNGWTDMAITKPWHAGRRTNYINPTMRCSMYIGESDAK